LGSLNFAEFLFLCHLSSDDLLRTIAATNYAVCTVYVKYVLYAANPVESLN